MQDLSKLTDDELRALANLQPVQPVQSQPLPEIAGANTFGQPLTGGPMDATRQYVTNLPDDELMALAGQAQADDGLGVAIGNRVRAFARGVPVAGSWADEANAAMLATVAPGVEGFMRGVERLGIPTPYRDEMRLTDPGDDGTWAERYAKALEFQRPRDAAFDEANPGESAALQLGGGVLGTIAGVLGAPLSGPAAASSKLPQFGVNALAPLSARLAPEAGVLARALAAGGEGAAIGAAQGAGLGEGALLDASRQGEAAVGGLIGGGAGAAFPLAARPLGAAWDATGGKALDAARSLMSPFRGGGATVDDLAQITGGAPGMPRALAQGPDRELQDLAATLARAPAFPEVSPSAMDDALARVVRAGQRQGMEPDDLVAAVAKLGPRAVLADTGDAMRTLTRDALNRPSGAEGIIRQNLDLRQMGVREGGDFLARPSSARIADAAAEGMGMDGKTALSTFDLLEKAQKEAADPLYAQVREIGATDSPKLEELSQRPSVKKALARAYRIAKEEGRVPEELALVAVESPDAFVSTLPPDEQAALRAQGAILRRGGAKPLPSRGPSLAEFISRGGGISDDGGELAAMGADAWHKGKPYTRKLEGQGGSSDDWALRAWEAGYFPQWETRPTTRQLYDALREEMSGRKRFARDVATELTDRLAARDAADEMVYRGGGGEPPPSPDDYVGRPEPNMEIAYQPTPTAETWDYVKRGLDDVLETYRNKTTGELVLDDEGRAVLRTLQELRGELINQNPIYGEALDAYSGPAAMMDALQAGRGAFRETGESLGRKFADFSTGEREMYRLGALQALREKLGNEDMTLDAARKAGILKPAQLERFKELFPTDKALQEFMRVMDLEQTMFQTRSAVTGNSTTAKQLASMLEEPPSPLETAADAGASVVTGGFSPLNILRAISRAGSRQMSPEAAEAVAGITTGLDQTRMQTILEEIYAVQRREALAQALGRAMGAGTAYGASSTVGGL